MKKILLALWLLSVGVMAEVTNLEVCAKFVDENSTKIIDIRTPNEWKKIGVVRKAYLITFFGKNNEFYGDFFLQELNKIVDKNETFAIISNGSSRSKLVSNFLGKKHDYKVINLLGGIKKLLKEGYKVKKYCPQSEMKKVKQVEVPKEEKVIKKVDENGTIK